MPEYTITAAAHKKDMPHREGMRPNQIIALTLTDGANTHNAEWITSKDRDPAGLVGTRISGRLEPGQYGLLFKKDTESRGRDPQDIAAMSRAHGQDMALAYMQVKATMGVLKEDFKPDALLPLIEWFQNDVKRHAAESAPGTVRGLPVRNEPVRTGAPDTVTPSAEYPGQHPEDLGDVPWGDDAA